MGIRIVNCIPMVEEHLRDSGFSQVPFERRGITLSTHSEFGSIVTVGSVDGSMRPVDHTEVAGYFEFLGENLAHRNERPAAIVFEGDGPVSIPVFFRDWCEEVGITIHVVSEDNVLGLAERLANGATGEATIEDRIGDLERALGETPFLMFRGDSNGPKRNADESEPEHWLRRLEEWLHVKRSNPSLWYKMVRGD